MPNCEFYIDAEVTWKSSGSNGIGSYEYHGSTYFDEGSTVWEIDTITFTIYDEDGDQIEPTPEMYDAVMNYIKQNAEPDFD